MQLELDGVDNISFKFKAAPNRAGEKRMKEINKEKSLYSFKEQHQYRN